MSHFIEFQDVCKYYTMGEHKIAAADHVSFYVEKGEFCIIVGPSGAGKTTVLNMLGGMDTCDEGKIILDGQEISGYNQKQLTTYRRYDVGFVFQFYNLVQNLTALENVELASEICKDPLDAKDTLHRGGLGGTAGEFPGAALRRGAAAGGHRPGAGQEPENPAVRRAHRRPGLQHRQGGAGAFAGHLPEHRPHGAWSSPTTAP